MASDRLVPTSATPGAVTGDAYMDAVSEEVTKLFDVSHITLTSVNVVVDGSPAATTITATLTPALTGSLVNGMKFTLPIGATGNTGATTLNINSGGAKDIVRNNGDATVDDDLPANAFIPLEYDSANDRFVILLRNRSAPGADLDYQAFTSSGTWTKPSGLATTARVRVEAWGAGGGGGSSQNGGGGGAYICREFRASELGSTVTVTIGAGGALSTVGGNTTFGAHLTAYGGGAGVNNSGGGGAGWLAVGAAGNGNVGGNGGGPDGGTGGSSASGTSSSLGGGGGGGLGGSGGHSGYGGGGGGGNGNQNGGNSVFGGGGGGNTSGGTSVFGGAGGASGVAGSAPAGGGGAGANGGRGECRVHVIG